MVTNNQKIQTWNPPEGYRAIPSRVDGITVYGPEQESKNDSEPTTFNCPNCGAVVAYDVLKSGIACQHCGYRSAISAKRVKVVEKNEFTLEALKNGDRGWGEDRGELHCENCGADLSVDTTYIATNCPFCDSSNVNIRKIPSDILKPKAVIPFLIDPQTNRDRARVWLKKGWFHPNELAGGAILDKFTGIYLPYWIFESSIYADWKAEVGHERTQRYYSHQTRTWQTKTVIHWQWENGKIDLQIKDLLVSGSSHISRRILERISNFDTSKLVDYSPGFLAGWEAHAYDIPLLDGWNQAKDLMLEKAKQSCRADIQSAHVRNFSIDADFSEEKWRYVLLPVYLASYTFKDKLYQIMVNGQNGAVGGQKPVDWSKVWLAIGLMLSPAILFMLIGIPLLIAGGVGAVPLFLGFILLVIGAVVAFVIYQNAVESERS